jgi:hypothetical protein
MNQENAFPLGTPALEDERSIAIELEAHDMSRFEWRVAVPLPVHDYLNYTVQADFELPSISTLSPSPWDQLQGFTRLEEPQVVGASADSDATVHLIRQQVLVLEQMLQRARQGVLRHCRLVCEEPGDQVAVESLITWLNTAFRALAAARARAVANKSTDSVELGRERALADEFVSVRLIDFVADAEAMLDETLLAIAAVDARFRPSLAVVDEHLVRALDAELNYRKVKGYPIADADSPSSLEEFVERSGRLKKHFEAELALDREAYPVDERLHIWFTCLAALIGGACAFALQTYLVRWSSERTVGWGLVGLTVLMGATYAMRDRIKEAFHRWLAAHVYRLYAQGWCATSCGTTSSHRDRQSSRRGNGATKPPPRVPIRSIPRAAPRCASLWSTTSIGAPSRRSRNSPRRASATSVSSSATILRRSVRVCTIRSRASPCSTRRLGGRSSSGPRVDTRCRFVCWPQRSRNGEK